LDSADDLSRPLAVNVDATGRSTVTTGIKGEEDIEPVTRRIHEDLRQVGIRNAENDIEVKCQASGTIAVGWDNEAREIERELSVLISNGIRDVRNRDVASRIAGLSHSGCVAEPC
jgi:hypothetical protein